MTTTAHTALSQRASKLSSLHKAMERKSSGSELQILKHLLKTMEITTAALSLPKAGSAPLYLGLSAATIGIYTGESETGIIGPGLAKVIHALTEGMSGTMMPGVSESGKQFLAMLCLTSYIFITCLASRTANQGVGQFPSSLEEADLKLARFFAFELSLKIVNSSSALKEAFAVFIEACGGDKTAQNVAASVFAHIGQLLIILAGSNAGRKSANHLIAEEEIYLKKGLHAAAEAVAKSEREGSINPAVAVAVNQLRIALDDHNETAFMDALNELLESLDTSLEVLINDLQQLHRIATMVIDVTGHSHDEDSFSGIINVI